MEALLSICLGVGLAAACGFRIFVPFLILNLASQAHWVQLDGSFAWMGSTPALIVFGIATVLEIGAYYIPWLDNALDSVATPIAVLAGIVVSASSITGIDPMLKWSMAVIAGGGAAGVIQSVTGLTRGASTLTTGGAGNFLVSTAEAVGSVVASLLSVLIVVLPVVAAVSLALFVFALVRWLSNRREQQALSPASGTA